MLAYLRTCDDQDKFPRFLPSGTRIAFEAGGVDAILTAAVLIETPGGTVALCVLMRANEDRRYVPDNAGNRMCAEVAREVFRHFGGDAPASRPPPETR